MVTAKDAKALIELRNLQKLIIIKKEYAEEIAKIETQILVAANNGKNIIRIDNSGISIDLYRYFNHLGFKTIRKEHIVKDHFFSDPEFDYYTVISW